MTPPPGTCAHCGEPTPLTSMGIPRRYCDFRCRESARNARRKNAAHGTDALCPECADLAHRRPRRGTCACGEAFVADVAPRATDFLRNKDDGNSAAAAGW